MTAEERIERARTAAHARWANEYDWENAPIDEAITELADLRACLGRAQEIVNRRIDVSNMKEPAFCYSPDCRKPIDLATGQWAGRRDRNNPETGQVESAYACSTRCWLYVTANFQPNPQATSHRQAPHVEPQGETAKLAIEHVPAPVAPTSEPAAAVPIASVPAPVKAVAVPMNSAVAVVTRRGGR